MMPWSQDADKYWAESIQDQPGSIASGDQSAWAARNLDAASHRTAMAIEGIEAPPYDEVRERLELLPVIDCTGDPPVQIDEQNRRVGLVREARSKGEAPAPELVLEFTGW